ncbi:hypothetical protein FY030_13920 [Ornithinimicrobium pratense]|uniref:Uncharacterized protein n=1 Tax=Ornithinimicrobium pratense TaxID=2593973 RepID=A0A5J6V745_9MICO|nr:hypothetical protein FY030_13920 [Ornithinimicrobium pratense]
MSVSSSTGVVVISASSVSGASVSGAVVTAASSVASSVACAGSGGSTAYRASHTHMRIWEKLGLAVSMLEEVSGRLCICPPWTSSISSAHSSRSETGMSVTMLSPTAPMICG